MVLPCFLPQIPRDALARQGVIAWQISDYGKHSHEGAFFSPPPPQTVHWNRSREKLYTIRDVPQNFFHRLSTHPIDRRRLIHRELGTFPQIRFISCGSQSRHIQYLVLTAFTVPLYCVCGKHTDHGRHDVFPPERRFPLAQYEAGKPAGSSTS